MKIGSLFAGIGGFDLAGKWMGWDTAWVSEIDPYASAVLAKHFPHAPNHGDITSMSSATVGPVDLLCGGFPCQDISLAGKGAGIDGERSGLWKHYARLIGELRPRWVVIENVAALRTRGLDVVLADLGTLGYDADWHCIPASFVGAPHRRDRIWIIAWPREDRLAGEHFDACLRARAAAVSNGAGERVEGLRAGGQQESHAHAGEALPLCGGEGSRHAGWDVEPAVGRVAHGVPARVDRLRCLGNAIVPQVALMIFQAIADVEALRDLLE